MTDRRQSILLLGTDLSTGGGVNRVIVDLADVLSSQLGHAVTIASARSRRPPSYAVPDGVRIVHADGADAGLGHYLRFLWRLRREAYDIVISFWTQDNILALLALAGTGKRVIACEHTCFFDATPAVRIARRLTYGFADAVTVLNRRELAHYRNYLSAVFLIPNAVCSALPSATEERGNVVLGVGHLVPRKGFDDLVRAVDLSGITRQGWRVRIVGSGPDRDHLQAMIADRALPGVEIVAPSNAIAEEYRAASIIVIPSRSEVFSLVLAEAAMSGVMPLAYDVDGPAYLLEDFPECLVPAGDVAELAARLQRLCQGRISGQRAVAQSIRELTAPAAVAAQWRTILAHPRRLRPPPHRINDLAGQQA